MRYRVTFIINSIIILLSLEINYVDLHLTITEKMGSHTQRHTRTHTDTHRHRYTERHTHTHRHRYTETHIQIHTYTHTHTTECSYNYID